jgi:hypothetical protein
LNVKTNFTQSSRLLTSPEFIFRIVSLLVVASASLSASVLFSFNAEDHGEGMHAVEIGSSYADVMPHPSTRAMHYQVEQPFTSKMRSWTYRIPEAGNYQVGMAWVEVASGDNVRVEIFKNKKEVLQAVVAQVGQVTRFEDRIEGLLAGDTVTVRMRPSGGFYRAAYHIALGTPIFNGLPVFDVHAPEFGAVGDGVTDDFFAIQAAVEAAKAAGGGIVEFDGSRTYRAIGSTEDLIESVLQLENTANILIKGNGANLVLHPPDRFALIHNSQNIQIDGLRVAYDPIPYYQGTIDAINLTDLTVDITVPRRYHEPKVGKTTHPSLGGFFAFTFIPNEPNSRAGWAGEHLHVASTELIDGDPQKIRIYAENGSREGTKDDSYAAKSRRVLVNAQNNGATEMIVPDLDLGHKGLFSLDVEGSYRVKLSNLLFSMMPHLGIGVNDNLGPITLSNVDLLMEAPRTELFWSWRGGYSIVGHNRWGLLIEDGEWHGNAMYDDILALYTRRQEIVDVTADKVKLNFGLYYHDCAHLFEVGDWVSIWTKDQSELRGMSRIVEITTTADKQLYVRLDSLPAGTSVEDVAINEELYNRNTLIRNCKNYPEGASVAGTRLRTGGHFLDSDLNGVYIITEFDELFKPVRARDLIIENCDLGSNRWNRVRLTGAINPIIINTELDGLYVYGNGGAEDIYLNSLDWKNVDHTILKLTDSSNAFIFGDSRVNNLRSGFSRYVDVDESSKVEYRKPDDYNSKQGGASESVPVPVAPRLTAMAGNGSVHLDWSDVDEAGVYTIYRSEYSGEPCVYLGRTIDSHYVDTNVEVGSRYYYVVSVVDVNGNESPRSNEESASPEGTVFSVESDAFVQAGVYANRNYGASVNLSSKASEAPDFARESYLRFDLSSLESDVAKATLSLKLSALSGSHGQYAVFLVSDDSWKEYSLNWNNKPTAGTRLLSFPLPAVGEWVTLDITEAVIDELQRDGTLSIVLRSEQDNLASYASSESINPMDRPKLTVSTRTVAKPPVPTGFSVVSGGMNGVSLSWDEMSQSGVQSYRLYFSSSSAGPFFQLVDTSKTKSVDADASPSGVRYYVLASIDASGRRSELSKPVKFIQK